MRGYFWTIASVSLGLLFQPVSHCHFWHYKKKSLKRATNALREVVSLWVTQTGPAKLRGLLRKNRS